MQCLIETGRFTVWQSALCKTTSSLIDLGDACLLTDPCWLPQEIDAIRDYTALKCENRQLYLLFTHADFDHILGYGAFPEAIVIASYAFTVHPAKHEITEQIISFDNQYYLQRNYPVLYPNTDIIIHQNGEKHLLGKSEVTFLMAPGHTSESMWAIVSDTRPSAEGRDCIWLAGDYFSNIEIPWIDDSLVDYKETVRNGQTLLTSLPENTYLVPGHGYPAFGKTAIAERISQASRYLDFLTSKNTSKASQIDPAIFGFEPTFADEMQKIHTANLRKLS